MEDIREVLPPHRGLMMLAMKPPGFHPALPAIAPLGLFRMLDVNRDKSRRIA
jgi:hypothetical protein